MTIMIKSIRLQRFKHFQDTTVHFLPFSILMGENNSGKTSILQALRLSMQAIYEGNLLEPGKRRKRKTSNDPDKVQTYNSYYMFDVPGVAHENLPSLFFGKKIGSSSSPDGGMIIDIVDEFNNTIRLQYRNLWNQLHISLLNDPTALRNPNLGKYSPLFISGYVGLNEYEERMYPASLSERTVVGQVSSIVRNIVLDLKESDSEKYNSLQELMKREFRFDISSIAFDGNEDRYIRSSYMENCSDEEVEFDFSSSGSGLLQILQIVAVIYRYCPQKSRVVLIDEPDAHLHNNLQVKFANILRRIQKSLGIQIIISTHSTAIIRDALPEEVIPVSFWKNSNKGLTDISEKQKNVGERLDSYELGKATISGKIAFFEDTDTSIYESMADCVGINCFCGVNTIPIIKGRGKDDKFPFSLHTIFKELAASEIEIHVIRDADGLPDDVVAEMASFASEKNVSLHVLDRFEIENYILYGNIIHRALLEDNPNKIEQIPTIQEIDDKIHDTLKATITQMYYNYTSDLAKNLYQVKHTLFGDNNYRPDDKEREATELQRKYELLSESTDLLRYGMGKETLKVVCKWLTEDLQLSISKKTIYTKIEREHVPSELISLFEVLQSSANRSCVQSESVSGETWSHLQLPVSEEPDDSQMTLGDYV